MELQKQGLAFPGDVLGGGDAFAAGSGTYLCETTGVIRATLLGQVVTVPASDEGRSNADVDAKTECKSVMHVISASQVSSQDTVIDIGDMITGRVVRISATQAFVTVLAVGDMVLRASQQPAALVRKEDIRLTNTDSLVVHECFRPGDIIEARVISLGDARQYFLSTAEPECGVRWARSEESSQLLVPLSWKEMQDPVTQTKEPRKVAKPRAPSTR